MPYVKCVNVVYNFETDVSKLIAYTFNPKKTTYPVSSKNRLIGAAPDIILSHLPGSEKRIAALFRGNHQHWDKLSGNLVHHTIISFEADEAANPNLIWSLAEQIAQDYFSAGFFCCYAVHTNSSHLHIHFVIDNISYLNGRSFFIPGEMLTLQEKAGLLGQL